MQELARRLGLHLTILCCPCGQAVSEGTEHTEMRFIDFELKARLDEWESMKN
jgi:hypothetical protein